MSEVGGVGVEPSARAAVFELLGMDAGLGTLAYWRSHALDSAVKSLRGRLDELAGGDVERWWSTASVADRTALVDQVEVPRVRATLRPWVDCGVQWGPRIPAVPLAAFLHAMAAGAHSTVAATADVHDITVETTPWELLERLDDHIADAPVPTDLPVVSGGLRLAFHDQSETDSSVHNPVRWLLELHPAATWDVLAGVAAAAVAKDLARRDQLAADRAAKKAAKGS